MKIMDHVVVSALIPQLLTLSQLRVSLADGHGMLVLVGSVQ